MWQNFTSLTPVPILSSHKVSLPTVHLKNSSLSSFALKSHTKFVILYVLGKMITHVFEFFIKLSFQISLFPHFVHAHSTALHNILSLTSSTLITTKNYSLAYKKRSIPNWWFQLFIVCSYSSSFVPPTHLHTHSIKSPPCQLPDHHHDPDLNRFGMFLVPNITTQFNCLHHVKRTVQA
jgi:hypothetical protein